MFHHVKPDFSNAPAPRDTYRIVLQVGAAAACLIAMTLLIVRPALLWHVDKPTQIKAVNYNAPASSNSASVSATNNPDPATSLPKTNSVDKEVSAKSVDVSIKPQAEKRSRRVKSHNLPGNAKHVKSGPSKGPRQPMAIRSECLRKPTDSQVSRGVQAAAMERQLSLIDGKPRMQKRDGTPVPLYRVNASTSGSYR